MKLKEVYPWLAGIGASPRGEMLDIELKKK